VAADLVHVGFGNFLAMDRVLAIVSPHSAPMRRLVLEAKKNGHVIDLTSGRKTKTALVMDTGYIVLTAIGSDTIVGRVSARAANPEAKKAEGEGLELV